MLYDNVMDKREKQRKRGPRVPKSKARSHVKGKNRESSKLLKSYPNDLIFDLESHLIEMNSPIIDLNGSASKKQQILSSLLIQQMQQEENYEKLVDEYVTDEYVEEEVDEEGKVLDD